MLGLTRRWWDLVALNALLVAHAFSSVLMHWCLRSDVMMDAQFPVVKAPILQCDQTVALLRKISQRLAAVQVRPARDSPFTHP